MEWSRTGAQAEAPAQEAHPVDDEGPSRFDVLLRNKGRLLLALLLLLLAAAVAVGSTAVFTSSSVNPDNTFTAGTLEQSNSKDNAAILTAERMVPGESRNGTVTIENTGDVSGAFSLSASDITNNPGPNGGNLSQALELTIVDTGPGQTIYNGPFASMPRQELGSWGAGESHEYQFTVTFPDSGKPADETSGDNRYEGSATSATYTWDAVSD
jgi:spore coat-associated protein N